MTLSLHRVSVLLAVLQFVSYIALSTLVQYRFYYRRSQQTSEWKTQPSKLRAVTLPAPAANTAAVLPVATAACPPLSSTSRPAAASSPPSSFFIAWAYPAKWLLLPSLPPSPHRHPLHALCATANLTISSLFAMMTTELHCRSLSSLGSLYPTSALQLVTSLSLAVLLQCMLEYYWHRMMHLPLFYRLLHKLHHHYTAPQPFDDLMIHPVEAAGYYCILYSPAFVVSGSVVSFACYMAIMGLCGMLDHCGVDVRVRLGAGWGGSREGWLLYDAREHDEHHRLFTVNYSFPFPFMDRLHGTYKQPLAK